MEILLNFFTRIKLVLMVGWKFMRRVKMMPKIRIYEVMP